MSYFEIETQLFTIRKDILPYIYELAYHLVFQNRNGSKKVDGGDWGVKLPDSALPKNFFFSDKALAYP